MDWLQTFDTGATLVVNSSWKNPSGEWRVGYKLVYELFTESLTSRLKVSNDLDYIDWLKSFNWILNNQVFCLCPIMFTLQSERKKKWEEKNQEAIAKAVKHLDEFNQVVEVLGLI